MEQSWWKNISKYFLHGILFSMIFLGLAFVLAFVFILLVTIGYLIGLIIGFALLFLTIGGLNNFLAEFIWAIRTKTAWMNLLGHGVILFIALVIVYIPSMVINFFVPSLATTIVLFIVNAFIDGFMAKNIAGWLASWEL